MIRRFLFGRRCVLCREPLALDASERAYLCPDCALRVRREYRCTHSKAVEHCALTDAVLFYKDDVRRAMVRVKFHHDTGALHWFAEQTAARLLAQMDDWRPDLVTYVPAAPLRVRARGFDQSAVIARRCAERCGLPCEPLLRRRLFARRQSELQNAAERRENAAHGFLPRAGAELAGKRVVLVDDILTSGATAAACARLLLVMGSEEVCLLTATRVP